MGSHPFEPLVAHVVEEHERALHRFVPLDVLVVDDDQATREGLVRAIHQLGHRCRSADCGAEAIRALTERPADVVISDWQMPGMNGAQLCANIRASTADEAPYVYFIVLTALHDRDHLITAMHAGADDYQYKPVNLDELEARLVSAARVVDLHRRLAMRTAALRHDSKRFYAASRTDPLTNAGNRLHMDEELNATLARGRRYGHKFSLAMCDLDFFKAFNDRFGHLAGDEALRRIAEALRANLRAGDKLFRYGGEEFAVLLAEQGISEAVGVMDRIRAAVERLALPSAATSGPMTISIGVAEIDEVHDRSPNDWIGRADAALYAAKAQGRNRVVPSVAKD